MSSFALLSLFSSSLSGISLGRQAGFRCAGVTFLKAANRTSFNTNMQTTGLEDPFMESPLSGASIQ
ncbi:hypothetical protein CVT26_000223 [Gymnopilus dilepis]|uniref:Secreted protein n=1 Tax=Gymnopilus dilepis TaxID=231916 RepID=A0A409VG63_9AGAR|nr:hypothetical protein CVT26_000223 [Gymnopilus dilepis]